MFTELLPLLAKHSLILTVGIVKDGAIRVTVTPRPSGKDTPKELSQPFVVEGTAAELDAELPKAIAEYASQLLTLEAGLAEVKANMDAALAEAKKEADKKVAEAKSKNKPAAKPTVTKPAVPEPAKIDATPSLFDAPEPAVVEPVIPAVADSDDEDSDSDEDGEEEDEEMQSASNVSPITTASAVVDASRTTNDLFSIEQEILQEVFHGTQDNRIAA